MINQYQHSETYFPSHHHHFHLSNTPSTNYNLLEENYVSQPSFYHPSEQYVIDNYPIQSFDQCYNEQSDRDFSLANNTQQSSIDQKPIVNEAKYKWMEIKRAPAKTSGNYILKYRYTSVR